MNETHDLEIRREGRPVTIAEVERALSRKDRVDIRSAFLDGGRPLADARASARQCRY